MGLHLVTGYAGYQHVTAADQGAFNSALLLSGNYVLSSGSKFAASVITNNSIKISDGDLIMQGRHVRLKPGEVVEVAIENGTQDYKRNDLIVARYVKDGTTGVENVAFVVIQGTPDISTASDPAYIEGNILNGVLTADFPLYRVPLDGLNVGELETLFEVIDSFDERIKNLIADVEDGSIVAGNAKQLGSETASAWQTKLDNIQTTSRATLSTAGWYRVAVRTAQASEAYYDFTFKLANFYSSAGSTNATFKIKRSNKNYVIKEESVLNNTSYQMFTKIRIVSNGTSEFLEVYYSQDYKNECFASVIGQLTTATVNNTIIPWTKLDFIPTSETVDGVTVTTTYDIPANASPVTDLDLVLAESSTKKLGSVTSLSELDNYYGVNGYIEVNIAGAYAKVFALTLSNAENLQIMSYSFNRTLKFRKTYFNSSNIRVWTDWDECATKADLTTALAGYVKNTGGDLTGVLGFNYNGRRIINQIDANGKYFIWDTTNAKSIISSEKDGTNTFGGTSDKSKLLQGSDAASAGGITGSWGVNTLKLLGNIARDTAGLYPTNDNSNAVLTISRGLNNYDTQLGFSGNGSLYHRSFWNEAIFGKEWKEILDSDNYTDYTIAKNGGTIGDGSAYLPFGVKGNSYGIAGIVFTMADDTLLGGLGYQGENNLVAIEKDISGYHTIHHDGNSAKVAIQESAPADTSALWVY